MTTFLIIFSIYALGVLLSITAMILFVQQDNKLAELYLENGVEYVNEEIDIADVVTTYSGMLYFSYLFLGMIIYEIIKVIKEIKSIKDEKH